jgi:predicted enzyme related to lactoylglutathione lyase
MPGSNGIGWFEIGTDDPAAAERFYGDVFGWTVSGASGHRLHQVVAFTTERVDAGVDADAQRSTREHFDLSALTA